MEEGKDEEIIAQLLVFNVYVQRYRQNKPEPFMLQHTVAL